MNYKTALINLYYLLINVDGKVEEQEIAMGKNIVKAEGILPTDFDSQMETLVMMDPDELYKECVVKLKALTQAQQIRSIAWLCITANSDGFMDKLEWQLIYKLYNIELKLDLREILKMQKTLLSENQKRAVTPLTQ
jgi:uncharacterized tellurite resistance protein B-like protein